MTETNFEKLLAICKDALDRFSGDAGIKSVLAAYLAQKLENNNAMIMPYKLGDKLYRANSWLDQVDELTVSMITQKKDGSWKIRTSSSTHKSVQDFSLENISDPKYDIYHDLKEAEEAHKKARAARFEALKKKIASGDLSSK